MGVPALFRWLSKKYPKIISPVIEEEQHDIGGAKYEDPNPNGEIDNLYLDMNGIVHPCSHPEHKRPPETEDEMFLDIFTYTDRVLMMARPRKVLMIAVDGVAPRAKMNQQRARRFRSAQDAKLKQMAIDKEIREKEARGEMINDAVKGKKQWDSNAITPGTPFMDRLAEALRYWVAYKLSTDPGWANLQVIISDATVPGEGEHKLMSFIRSQRSDPQYNPNTRHCIYGLDADLIFLGLATHEPHFRVLREDVFANQERHMTVSDHVGMSKDQLSLIEERDKKKPFLWLHVNVLREYLGIELYNPQISFPFDLERAIDDWVFICFFAGNDFLPHLPSLDVRDNGIDTLVNCWKRCIPRLRDYLTCDGKLNLQSVETLLGDLAIKEDEIFRNRFAAEKRRKEGRKRRKVAEEQDKALKSVYMSQVTKGKDKAPIVPDKNMPLMDTSGNIVEGYASFSNKDIVENRDTVTLAGMANNDAAAALKKLIDSKKQLKEDTPIDTESSAVSTPTSTADADADADADSEEPSQVHPKKRVAANDEEPSDDIRLHEPGYQKRYYQVKFHCKTDEEVEQVRREVVKSYIEGISWVALYYYQGCPSWTWFYPYHYAPFASDMTNLKDLFPAGIKFDLGEPFRPYEQLMSVLPAASSHALPDVFHTLMKDPDSEIIEFYPEEFEIDMNGKKMSWQGIPLLPFIDEKRLLDAVQGKYDKLTAYEKERNTNKQAELFISNENKNYERFAEALYKQDLQSVKFSFAKSSLAGLAIKFPSFDPCGTLKFPLKEGNMPNINKKDYLQVEYHFPQKAWGKSMLLNGFIPAVPALTTADRNEVLYQLQSNNVRGNSRGFNNNFQASSDYVNHGPQGKEVFKMYSMRRGGYRSSLQHLKDGGKNERVPAVNNASPYGIPIHQPQQNQYGYGYSQVYGNQANYGATYNQFGQASAYQPQSYQSQTYQRRSYQPHNGNSSARSGYFPPPGPASGRNGYR
ncbi:RAT1 [Candida theae]|uniref:5'-3' exoribonuclease n=1 Tax=Candida theae TaxID=1198502 RepID=A0AAD5BAS4_9ASCO|nr:RAT1 [Candida theae]KAI5949265.1 RAT1 [Candida theae]